MAGKQNWDGFKLTSNGTRIFNHGADECVAVANLHNEEVLGGTFVAVNSAKQWWLNYNQMPALNRTFKQSQTPTAGAIAVWKPNAANGWHGHIGSVLDIYPDGTFLTLEQNYGTGNQRWAYRYRRRVDNTLYGFLIPHNNPAGSTPTPSKPDTPAPIEGEENMPWIAVVGGTWYLVVPTGNGKPNASVLGGKSGAEGQFKTVSFESTDRLKKLVNIV